MDEEGDPHEASSGVREDLPEELEETPLGATDPRPEGEGDPPRGPDAMPGIPTEGEPPSAG